MPDELGTLVAKLAADMADLKKGLAEGRQELTSFKSMVESAGARINEVLRFVGISFGIYEVISKLKEFGSEVLKTGGKSEVLRAAMYAIGQHYTISGASLDLYIEKLTKMGVSQENALQSVNNFLKSGLSIDLLPQLAAAAQDLAPSMALPFNEAFEAIIQSVTKGTPKALAELTPGIKQAMQAASSETLKLMDSTILSGTEKSKIMVDFVLEAGKKVEGAGASISGTYLKQINDYKRAVREVKEALFEFVKPISMAITGAEIKSWQDFYEWIVKNRAELAKLGEIIGIYLQKGLLGTKQVIEFVYAHKELLKVLLEVWGVMKVISWFRITEGAAAAAIAVGGLTGKLAILRAALSSPWVLVITVSVLGLMEALKQLDKLDKGKTRGQRLAGEAYNLMTPEQQAEVDQAGQDEFEGYETPTGVTGKLPAVDPEVARLQAQLAALKGKKENALQGGGKGGKGGKGGAEEDLFGAYLKVLEQQRQAELQAAQDSLELLKATNDKKRAELEKSLAEGLIDGQTYYARLQELQKGETDAALALIEKKRQVQAQAHQDALAQITENEQKQKISPEMADYQRQQEEAKQRMIMAQLTAEATRVKLDGEKKVTEELKRQLEVQQQYKRQAEDLNVETGVLLGAISQQEASLQKLYLDWQRTKQEALKAGASPEFFQGLEANYQAKKADIQFGGYASAITQGVSSLVDALMEGGQNLKQAAHNIFKSIFNEAMKPGLEQLKGMLVNGFKQLFGEAGTAISSAIMGVIGLIGMLLTSGGGESSWSPSGVTSGVTAHEAIRGVIAGETSIPIAEIGENLQDALVPTNAILGQIEENTRSIKGFSMQVTIPGLEEALEKAFSGYLERYFETLLQTGGA